ncbi:MAG TPA: ATP-binding protein [Thermoanaerobaculia bacterium]|nr:ATP-binding protein [Thermoanaerobaculia bacterium]
MRLFLTPPAVLETVLVAGMVASPLLPSPWSALSLAAFAVAWMGLRRSRELIVAGPILALGVVALVVSWTSSVEARASRADWIEEARHGYQQLWRDLGAEAAAAAKGLGPPPEGSWENVRTPQARLAAFQRLAAVPVDKERGRRALLLVDPDGLPVAWAGEGLLHELNEGVPSSGLHFRAGFSAVTLFTVRPLENTRRPWRVVAGVSFSTDTLPFPNEHRSARWSLVQGFPSQETARDVVLIGLANAPTLVVERASRDDEAWGLPWMDRLAWLAIGIALLALAVLRGLRIALPGGRPIQEPRTRVVTPLALAGLVAVGAAAEVPPYALIVLAAGLGLAALGVHGRSGEGDRLPASLKGAGAVLMLFGAALAIHWTQGPLDVAEGILVSPWSFALRLGLSGAAFGVFCLAGRRKGWPPAPPRDRWAWAAVLLLLLGAALADFPVAALLLLGLGGAAAALYADQRRLGEGMTLLALILMSVIAASGTWETAYRLRLREFAGTELLARLSPPRQEEISGLAREIQTYFQGLQLDELVPRSPAGLERQDLAYAFWRESPLARHGSLSALVVQPADGGAPSSFSFGIPLTEEGGFDLSPLRREELRLPLWGDALVSGAEEIRFAGKPWGRLRYWLVPRPGFQTRDWLPLKDVETGLLRGAPVEDRVESVARPAVYALYSSSGHAVLSPWEEAPPLPPQLRNAAATGSTSAIVSTPTGRARAWARSAPDGWEVVFLPFLSPLPALERTGRFAVGTLVLLAVAALPVLLLALPRAAFRDILRRTVRSYSKRLMIIYTALLLVPLLLLYAVLVRAMEDRLAREQRAAGEAALSSSQQLLAERLLTLAPGFGVDTAFGDQLLDDMSDIVRHEVNLYWGSGIHASSRHELFTAGLLPRRIPGEMYSRLTLLGYGLASRTNRVGGTTYLEMYAPLRVPGTEGMLGEQERLFVLSVPLLAQQEEAARQLWQLRGQGLLVTVALFLLLVAVGRRLARNFTQPLMQLVEGTRRIAAGAPSLDLAPTELELAALVEAVDEMARRIAEGREKLVREKQVVERMVENITSGIVSVDRDRRVLMHNRVAAELLGTRVGESLEDAVSRSERLAPVESFLGGTDGEMARETVRLRGEDGTEREWALVWVPVPGSGEPSALLVVEDATEVLRGQRLLAWAEMARMIAHEIKNPLTPIRLSAEHMREVYQRDPDHFDRVFERCTTNILTQVDELRSIASDFSTYSSIPRIDPKPGDLVATMKDLVEGYRAAPPNGVKVEFETERDAIPARFDAKLLHRAVRNLIENALRASAGGGEVRVRIDQVDHTARIAVFDSGPGVKPDLLLRIFDPYFSTHDTGTGLGLPIARRIAEEHGGDITAKNRAEGGLEVTVTLPVSE